MNAAISPVGGFTNWLPGEMRYIAEKHGYVSLVNDCSRPADDPRSINGRLSNYWFLHQILRRHGSHHADSYQKTAQSQLAKFAAGLFMTAAVARWLSSGNNTYVKSYLIEADRVSDEVRLNTEAGLRVARFESAAELEKPYEETCFQTGVISLMRRTVIISDAPDDFRRPDKAAALHYDASHYGYMAMHCYEAYANADLTPEQYTIPPSRHAD